MNTLALTMALVLSVLACGLFYLASSHQRWRAAPLPSRPARAAAVLLALASLLAFTRAMDTVPAVFAFIDSLMLLLVVLPYLGAARALARGSRG